MYFKAPEFMKIFCKLTYALVNDINRKLFFETHTKIPLLIHKLISPVLEVLATADLNYFEYPSNFTLILEKSVCLNPLTKLVPFAAIAPVLQAENKDQFDRLLRAYFDHIHRL